MHLHVFDLDHTLLTVNSSFQFGLFLYRHNYFSCWKLCACLSDYARYKWCGMSLQSLHHQSFKRLFYNRSSQEIYCRVEDFLDESFDAMLYQPVMEHLKMAQSQGDKVLILSSSPDFLVRAIANRLGVQQWKGTGYQIDDEGKFSFISHVMDGEDKANDVKTFVDQMGLSLSATSVYSDSYLDLPVLKIAGRSIGVRPDWRLRNICIANQWEIL